MLGAEDGKRTDDAVVTTTAPARRDYEPSVSDFDLTDFASGGAARRAVSEAGITGWLQERTQGHLGRSPKSDDAAEVIADPSAALV